MENYSTRNYLGIWKNRAKKDEKGLKIRLTAKTQFISFKVAKVIFNS